MGTPLNIQNGITSMLSDMNKHEETKLGAGNILAMLGMQAIMNNDMAAARRFVVGFN